MTDSQEAKSRSEDPESGVEHIDRPFFTVPPQELFGVEKAQIKD